MAASGPGWLSQDFLFASWVLAAHTYNYGAHERALPVPSQSGLMAVLCFFAISGYSIHHSISSQPVGYGRRRLIRILPVHLTAIGLTFAAYLVLGPLYDAGSAHPMPAWWHWVAYLTLLNVFILPAIINVMFPLWSLSVEVIFYALAPFLRRVNKPVLLAIIVGSSAVLIISGLAKWQQVWVAPYGLQLAVFGWAWLAGWLAYSSPRKGSLAALCVVVGCVAVATNPGPFWLTARHVYFWTYGSWIVTVWLLFFPPRSNLPAKLGELFKYLGDLSFPLYIIHYPVLTIAFTTVWLKHPSLNYGWVHAVISIAAAALVLRYIERPLKAWFAAGSERSIVAPDAYPVPAPG